MDQLRQKVKDEADNLVERVNTWRDDCLREIEEAEKSELLREVKAIGARFTAIEGRLTAIEDRVLERVVVDED